MKFLCGVTVIVLCTLSGWMIIAFGLDYMKSEVRHI